MRSPRPVYRPTDCSESAVTPFLRGWDRNTAFAALSLRTPVDSGCVPRSFSNSFPGQEFGGDTLAYYICSSRRATANEVTLQCGLNEGWIAGCGCGRIFGEALAAGEPVLEGRQHDRDAAHRRPDASQEASELGHNGVAILRRYIAGEPPSNRAQLPEPSDGSRGILLG
jgi:hypothetical protein